MMFERFTRSARQVVVQAQHNARRFGHNYIGPEHLFLGVVAADDPASALLRDLGLTPERTEAEFIRLTRAKPTDPERTRPRPVAGSPADPGDVNKRLDLGNRDPSADPAPGPLAGLDREALASIGIDLNEVQTRIEATFGPGALSRAVPRDQQRHRMGPALGRGLLRRNRRPRGRTGPETGTAMVRGHIPFTPRAKKSLELSLREALSLGDNYIGMEHVALALISLRDGVVPHILAGVGVSPDTLRAALLDQHRKAS
jgi:Clp amino terminal domain, pathogenicity island component